MIRILIVDDHEVVRDGIKKIFDECPGTALFGEASTIHEALKLAREQDWDVVVLDISLGGRSGLELLKELRQTRPRLPVLILSMHSEEQYARRAFKAGAAGYVTKDSPRAELAAAIKKVAEGGRYVSPAVRPLLTYPSIGFSLSLQTYYLTRLSNLAAADSRARHEISSTASPLTLVSSALRLLTNPDCVAKRLGRGKL